MNKFHTLFGEKPVIGMIHVTRETNPNEAYEDIITYQENGVKGVVIKDWEDIHTSTMKGNDTTFSNLLSTLSLIKANAPTIPVGINVLPNDYSTALSFAQWYRLPFVQARYVAGEYEQTSKDPGRFDEDKYNVAKRACPDKVFLGGVWPKDHFPKRGSIFQDDVLAAKDRCDAIVISGNVYVPETKSERIQKAKDVVGNFPVIAGSRVGMHNIEDILSAGADGVMIGRHMKYDELNHKRVDPSRLTDFMQTYNEIKQGQLEYAK